MSRSSRTAKARRFSMTSLECRLATGRGVSQPHPVSVAACEVESDKGFLCRALKDLLVAECADGVVVTRTPMILPGLSRELVVLGITFVAARLVAPIAPARHL